MTPDYYRGYGDALDQLDRDLRLCWSHGVSGRAARQKGGSIALKLPNGETIIAGRHVDLLLLAAESLRRIPPHDDKEVPGQLALL